MRHQRRQPARATIAEVVRRGEAHGADARSGIHTHNDSDVAVANALAAVEAGCTQVQGTINGWGERCGNANLISIIPALQLKMDRRCVPDENLARADRAVARGQRDRQHPPARARALRRARRPSRTRAACTSPPSRRSPPATSTSRPSAVGNRRHIVVSELSGRGNVRMRASELGVDVAGQRAGAARAASRSSRARATSSRRPRARSSCSAGAAQPGYVAAVRGAGRGRDLRAAARQLDVRRGDGQAEDRRRDRAHRRRGRRARCTRSTARSTRR